MPTGFKLAKYFDIVRLCLFVNILNASVQYNLQQRKFYKFSKYYVKWIPFYSNRILMYCLLHTCFINNSNSCNNIEVTSITTSKIVGVSF